MIKTLSCIQSSKVVAVCTISYTLDEKNGYKIYRKSF